MQKEAVRAPPGMAPKILGSRTKLPYVQVNEADLESSVHDVVMFPKLGFRHNIAGLRAIAVLAVVLYHFGLAFPGGFAGVDVFFVISGYLITRMNFHEFEQNSFSILRFWNRRVRRLQPALLGMVASVGPVAHMVLTASDYRQNATEGVFALLSMANFKFYTQSGYADHPDRHLFLHCWSLAVEDQFYACYPVLCACLWWCARRCSRSWCRLVLAASSLILPLAGSLCLSIWSASVDANLGFYMFPARAWEMLAGALTAMLCTHLGEVLSSFAASCISCLLQVSGLGVIAVSFLLLTDATPYPSFFALLPCLGTVLILYADGLIESNQSRGAGAEAGGGVEEAQGGRLQVASTSILGNRPCVWIGEISYSWYLWHWPIYVLCKRVPALSALTVEGILPLQSKIAAILASFAIACCSYKLVENPWRRKSSIGNTCFWFIMVAMWLGVSLCLFVSSDLYPSNGGDLEELQDVVDGDDSEECILLQPETFPEEQWQHVRYSTIIRSGHEWGGDFQMKSKPNWEKPWIVRPSNTTELTPSIVFIGSSHCTMYLHTMVLLAKKFDRHMGFMCVEAGVIKVHAFEREGKMRPYDTQRLKFISKWKPEVVVWADRWDHYYHIEEPQWDVSWKRTELTQMFARTFGLLLNHTQRLLVMEDTPHLKVPTFLTDYVAAWCAKHGYSDLTFLRHLPIDAEVVNVTQFVQEKIARALDKVDSQGKRTTFVRIAPFLRTQDAERAPIVLNPNVSQLMFRDSHHLNNLGVAHLVPLLRVHVLGQRSCKSRTDGAP